MKVGLRSIKSDRY